MHIKHRIRKDSVESVEECKLNIYIKYLIKHTPNPGEVVAIEAAAVLP